MINKIFRHDGAARAAIRYCLSPHDHTGSDRSVAPKVVFGDPDDVVIAARAITGKSRCISGALSFAEEKISIKVLRQIVREHQHIMFPGVDPREIACCYILHRDKRRVELHYVYAKVHLLSGKRLGYYHKVDRRRLRLWVQTVNDRFGFADPNDPKRWRLFSPANRESPASRKEKQTLLLEGVERMALAGVVQNRADIERELLKAGWQISRRSKNFISVTSAKLRYPIRLAGNMFSAQWSGALDRRSIAKLSERFQRDRIERLERTIATLETYVQTRALYYARRFGSQGRRSAAAFLKNLRSSQRRQEIPPSTEQTVLSLGQRQISASADRKVANSQRQMRGIQ